MSRGSSSNNSTEDHSSGSGIENKIREQFKPDSSTSADANEDCTMTSVKESSSCPIKEIAEIGKAGHLVVIDKDKTDSTCCNSPIVAAQEEKVHKMPIKSSPERFEEVAICLDDSLIECNAKHVEKDIKEITKPAAPKYVSTKLTKSPDKSSIKNKLIWVSNILPSTKASDLKIHFSKYAKITTARVVTNGRKYYGCLTVEHEDSIKECIKQLNNTIIDGQEIKVQFNAPDNDTESTEEQQKRSSDKANQQVPPTEKSKSPDFKSVRPSKKTDRKFDKLDPLTRFVKSPKRNPSKSKEVEEHTRRKRRRSRSNSIEIEMRLKTIELRRLTADIEELQRRKERMVAEEKEKERERRENERIQEMRRKMEEERAQKRMEIQLANKSLDFERKLLEKERDAFMKLKTIEMEELRIRSETKRKIEEAEEYQRSLARKVPSKECGDRKSSSSLKRYHETFNDGSIQRNRTNNSHNHSPSLYSNSQKFDIKPLKRDGNNEKYPSPPKISLTSTYNQHIGNNSKENRYNNKNPNLNKYSGGCNTSNKSTKSGQHGSSFNQTKPQCNNSTWLPSTLATSSNYRQQQSLNESWQQLSSKNNGSSKQLGVVKYGGSAHEYHHHHHQQQQQQQQHDGGMRHQVQYPNQMINGGSGKGGGRMHGGVYQGGRRY